MDRRKFLIKMNQKAVFSAVSGRPVIFVDRITDEIRRNAEDPYTDGMNMFDPAQPEVNDMEAVFALTREGEGVAYLELLDSLGEFAGDDRAFLREIDRRVFDRDEVQLSEGEDDEEDEEGEEIELLRREGLETIGGFAVRVEDAASTEGLIGLIEKFGYDIKDQMIEFMAQHWPMDEEDMDPSLHGLEVFYRMTGGDSWIQSYFTLIPGDDAEEFFVESLPAVMENIKWDRLAATRDEEDESFEVSVGVPVFR